MTFEELAQEIQSQIEGLDNWEIKGEHQLSIIQNPNLDLGTFASFSSYSAALTVYRSTRSEFKWEIYPNWRLDGKARHYKSDKGLIKKIGELLAEGDKITLGDLQRKATYEQECRDTQKVLEPYITEYGDIFKVDGTKVWINWQGMSFGVDIEKEMVNLGNDWTSTAAPLHLTIPFLKEVVTFKLLE